MLDRETCEALARAYPEIGGHREENISGWDLAYHRKNAAWSLSLMAESAAPYPEDALWCPRLEDLLALAHARCGPGEAPDLWYGLRREGDRNVWRFSVSPATDDQFQNGTEADTPQAAVAAWLLAHAGQEPPSA